MSDGRIIEGLPYSDYAALPGVRSSDLGRMAKSPLHYRHPAPDKDTAARVFLRAVHALALEPECFGDQFVTWTGGARRGKAWEAFEELNAGSGRAILTMVEEERARQVVAGILRHPEARALLTETGASEVTITWTDPATGLPCKARLDRMVKDAAGYTVVDLKGYGTSVPRMVSRMIAQRLAHVQAAHYAAALVDGMGVPAEQVRSRIVSYETTPPYDVCVMDLTTDGALYLGQRERRRMLDTIAACEAAREWPGCAPDVVRAELPAYAWGEDEDIEINSIEEDAS